MNYLEASNYIFENADELIAQNKVLVGLHYVNQNKRHRVGSFLIMKPFKNNDKYAYYLYVMVSRKLNKPLHLRGTRNFVVKQERHEKFAALQPKDVANLNYQILPSSQVDGVVAEDLANNMLDRLNLKWETNQQSSADEERAAAPEQTAEA